MAARRRAETTESHIPTSGPTLPATNSGVSKPEEIPALSDYIGTDEVARLCDISPKTVWHLVWEGTIPEPTRVGRTLLWRRSVIEEWARERPRRGRPRGQSAAE